MTRGFWRGHQCESQDRQLGRCPGEVLGVEDAAASPGRLAIATLKADGVVSAPLLASPPVSVSVDSPACMQGQRTPVCASTYNRLVSFHLPRTGQTAGPHLWDAYLPDRGRRPNVVLVCTTSGGRPCCRWLPIHSTAAGAVLLLCSLELLGNLAQRSGLGP